MADYAWQIKAVARFVSKPFGAIVAACGTGKTRAAINLALAKESEYVLVIAPKRLTEQWAVAIREIAGNGHEVFVYDKTLDSKATKKSKAFMAAFEGFLDGRANKDGKSLD